MFYVYVCLHIYVWIYVYILYVYIICIIYVYIIHYILCRVARLASDTVHFLMINSEAQWLNDCLWSPSTPIEIIATTRLCAHSQLLLLESGMKEQSPVLLTHLLLFWGLAGVSPRAPVYFFIYTSLCCFVHNRVYHSSSRVGPSRALTGQPREWGAVLHRLSLTVCTV